jgi:hypothetical protein
VYKGIGIKYLKSSAEWNAFNCFEMLISESSVGLWHPWLRPAIGRHDSHIPKLTLPSLKVKDFRL